MILVKMKLKFSMRQNKSSENRSQDVNPLKEIDFVVGGRRCAPKISHSDILKSTGGRVTVPHRLLPSSDIRHKSSALGKSTDA